VTRWPPISRGRPLGCRPHPSTPRPWRLAMGCSPVQASKDRTAINAAQAHSRLRGRTMRVFLLRAGGSCSGGVGSSESREPGGASRSPRQARCDGAANGRSCGPPRLGPSLAILYRPTGRHRTLGGETARRPSRKERLAEPVNGSSPAARSYARRVCASGGLTAPPTRRGRPLPGQTSRPPLARAR
jgi:hypothetical protein